MKKRITVLMSVYNGERYLRSSIESILAQTYKDFEFVIYDDCSSDKTSSIITSYRDSRIIYRRNNKNQGLTYNLSDGVSRSEADYIVRMDADDIAYPNRLKTQLEWMDAHPEVCILGSSVSYFREKPGDLGDAIQPADDATIKAMLFISFTLLHPSIMIRRSVLKKYGLNYDVHYRYSQDHALYFECIYAGLKFANISLPLLYMRSHGESISRAKHGVQQECSREARLNFLKKTGLINGCSSEEFEAYNRIASGYYPETGGELHSYEQFVYKIYKNPLTEKFFNRDLLCHVMSDRLCNDAYYAVATKQKKMALLARRSFLIKYSSKWTILMYIKFLIKLIIK